jgi:cytidylate kinase
MIITIDGCAGSGKTSAAKQLALALSYDLLRTGEMYRATALILRERCFTLDALSEGDPALQAALAELTFDLPPGQIWVNGQDYTQRIKAPGTSEASSLVAKNQTVRERLKAEQKRLAAGKRIVCEGRDQGTAVFPDAPLKFYFHAHVRVRAARRVEQHRRDGFVLDPVVVEQELRARDKQDTERHADPLRIASDAFCIDTSHITEAAVLAWLLERVQTCPQ